MIRRILPVFLAVTVGVFAVLAFWRTSASEMQTQPITVVDLTDQLVERPLVGRVNPAISELTVELIDEHRQVLAMGVTDQQGMFFIPVEFLPEDRPLTVQIRGSDMAPLELTETYRWSKDQVGEILEIEVDHISYLDDPILTELVAEEILPETVKPATIPRAVDNTSIQSQDGPAAVAANPVVTGRVTAADTGEPLGSADLDFENLQTGTTYSISPDQNGYYTASLAVGPYAIDGSVLFHDFFDFWLPAPDIALAEDQQTVLDMTADRKPIISGTVVSAVSGQPLPNVWVQYRLPPSYKYQPIETQTDANGRYEFRRALEYEGVTIKAWIHPSSITETAYLETWLGDVLQPEDADYFDLERNQVSNGDISLQVGGWITGVISAPEANAISRFEITAYHALTPTKRIAFDVEGCHGGCSSLPYRLAVPPGDLIVKVTSTAGPYAGEYFDDVDQPDQATLVTVAQDQTVTDINFVLERGGTLNGQVAYDSSQIPGGEPDVGTVYLFDADNDTPFTYTDLLRDGTFEFRGLESGIYYLGIDPDNNLPMPHVFTSYDPATEERDPILVTKGTTTTLGFDLDQGVTISGVVTSENTGAPLEGIEVLAVLLNSCGLNTIYESTHTATDGTYAFNKLRAGQYRITFSDESSPGTYVWTSQNISTSEGETHIIDQALQVGGQLSGQVTASDNSAPLEDIDVFLYVYSDEEGRFLLRSGGRTKADGSYSLTRLEEGDYIVYFDTSRSASQYAGEFHDDQLNQSSATVISIDLGQSVTVDESLQPGGSITGRVVSNELGVPITGATVKAFAEPVDDRHIGYPLSAKLTASGYYTITGLAPGDYRVKFEVGNESGSSRSSSGGESEFWVSHNDEYYGGGIDPAAATVVTVSSGNTVTGIDQGLDRGGFIKGTIHLIQDIKIPLSSPPAIRVKVYDSSGLLVESIYFSTGSYQIGGLPPGTYYVRFGNWDSTYRSRLNDICVEDPSYVYGEYYGGSADFAGATPVVITGTEFVEGIDGFVDKDNPPTLEPGEILYEVSGQVTDGGIGVGGVLLEANSGQTTYTAADGTYTIDIPSGSRTITPHLPGSGFSPPTADLAVTADQSGVDFAVGSSLPGGSINGEVAPAVEGLDVQAYRVAVGQWILAGLTTTAADGTFSVDGLPAGTYRLRVTDRQYQTAFGGGSLYFQSSLKTYVAAGQTTTLANPIPISPAAAPKLTVGGVPQTVDPDSGKVAVRVANGESQQVTFSYAPTCPSGLPTHVRLVIGTESFPMISSGGGSFAVSLTLPDDLAAAANQLLAASYMCGDITRSLSMGSLTLYDPSGIVTDARTGQPIAGATVSLYRLPLAEPDRSGQVNDCRTIDTRPASSGGPFGEWSALPPANAAAGQLVNADVEALMIKSPFFDPAVNPQQTDDSGRYGWDVVEGCWFVTAQADGYKTLTSPLVGVPPAVTDLDLALTPDGGTIYLPVIAR